MSVSFIIVNLHRVIDMDWGDSTGMSRLKKETWDAIEEARRLLADMDLENGRLRIFFRSFLHMMMLILKEVIPVHI